MADDNEEDQLSQFYWEGSKSFWYDYPDDVYNECSHEWKTYLGIIEIHEYCTKCDKIRKRRKGGYLDDPIDD